jgi:Holliday junction resolvase
VSGGRASRQKGNRTERAIVRALQDAGFAAERVPLSGAAFTSNKEEQTT